MIAAAAYNELLALDPQALGRPAPHVDMDFRPGAIQGLDNSVTPHAGVPTKTILIPRAGTRR